MITETLNAMWKKTIILSSLLVTIGLHAQTPIEAALQEVAEEYSLVGLSVVLTCGEDIQESFHYGLRDIGNTLPIDNNTRYRIASISKTVTAIGLLKLYEEGSFDLDEDVSDYIGFELRNPSFPEVAITFRHLLTHQSGIRDGNGYFDFLSATYSQTPVPALEELILPGGSYYTSDVWSNHMPGTYFQYSNLNFGVIATLIESIAQKRFDQFMRSEVLIPLGIDGSFNVQDISAINDVAVLYRNGITQSDNYQGQYPEPLDLNTYTPGINGLIFSPQGGLRVSAEELSVIMRMLIHNGTFEGVTILQAATVQKMIQNEWLYDGTNGDNYYNLFNSWGLGIQRTTNTTTGDIVLPGITCYGHAGEAYGLISDMYFNPEHEFGIVFMTNGYYGASNYSFGDYSAFYLPEETAFSAIAELSFPQCQNLSSQEEVFNQKIEIYPNPATSEVYVNPIEYLENIEMMDALGKRIIVPINGGKADISLVKAGLYYFIMEDGQGNRLYKAISIVK